MGRGLQAKLVFVLLLLILSQLLGNSRKMFLRQDALRLCKTACNNKECCQQNKCHLFLHKLNIVSE